MLWSTSALYGNKPQLHHLAFLPLLIDPSVQKTSQRRGFPDQAPQFYKQDSHHSTAAKCYFEAFHSVCSCSQSLLLFKLNAHNMLTTYIYHQLSPTYFGIC